MKMKSVVLAAATAVASSVFAQIFDKGDVYAEWFTSNATDFVEFETELDSPSIVTNLAASAADGYAVTAVVAIVVHSGLPEAPGTYDGRAPKGAICAAVVESVTNWYGLAGGVWVSLTGVGTPTEGTENQHTLVMEFKDKDGAHKVRYSIDEDDAENGWLDSGSSVSPKYVAFAGSGHHKDVKGLLVYEKAAPSVSTSSWTEGYDFTNGTVSVTLGSYDRSSMGEVSLVVKDSTGAEVGSAAFGDETQSVTPTLTPGGAYTYSIVQNAGGVVTTNDLGTFIAAAPGAGFSASAEGDSSAVYNGDWETAAPAVDNAKYAISGSEVFNIGEGALEANKLVIVDNKVTFTTWGDASDLQSFTDGTFAAITAVTNGSGIVVWKAYNGTDWSTLDGGVATETGTPYDIRAMFDFTGSYPKAAFSMKVSGDSMFSPFTCNNNAWITSTVATNVLSEVGYSGIGKLTSVVGGNSDTNIAAVGTTSYATLADAIAAATNGSNTVTLRTNTQWPGTGAAGKYTILTNGFVLAGIVVDDEEIALVDGKYVITLSAGICAVEGGKLNVDADALSAIIGGSASGKTPEEITAALTAKADNGVEKWVNYVLGIDGSDAANKPFAAPVQNADPSKLTFSLGGVDVNEGTGATVRYSVEALALPTDTTGDTVGPAADASSTIEVDVPTSGVKYYRVKVTITLPE